MASFGRKSDPRALDLSRDWKELLHFFISGEIPDDLELDCIEDSPEIRKLLASLPVWSPSVDLGTPDRLEEWNPFSQRPVLSATPREDRAWGDEFLAAEQFFRSFIMMAHEALHILLWEPFFAGSLSISSSKQFIGMSLCAEAFCFFHSDIVLTRKIRETLPDGEVVFSRSSVSSRNFHPYRAFRAIGVSKPDRILDLYLEAFSGERTGLLNSRDPFASSLCDRIYKFYAVSRPPLERLYQVLRATGIFDEFRTRFCSMEGLPALLPSSVQALASEGLPKDYIRAVFKKGLKALGRLPEETVQAVRRRRMIQVRAYFTFQLRYVLEKGLHSPTLSPRRQRSLLAAIESYLSQLQTALACFGKPRDQIRYLREADRYYEASLQAPLSKQNLWVSRRELIFPRRLSGTVGSGSPRKEARIAAHLLQELAVDLSQARGPTRRRVLLEQIRSIAASGASGKSTAWLTDPGLLSRWSVRLGALSPSGGRFREVLFEYR